MSRLRANKITNQAADGAPTVQHGLIVSGVTTVTGSINNLNLTGITTVTTLDLNGDIDVDGHTNLDNVSIAGVTTSTGNIYADNYFGNSSLTLNNNGNPSINITSTSTTGSSRIFFGDPDSALVGRLTYSHNGDYMQFFTAYGERLRIQSNGNVGIGTNNPQCLLDLSKDISGGVNYVDIRNHHATGGAALRVKTQGTYGSPTYQAILGASDAGGTIRVGAVSNHPLLLLTNNTERLHIKADGKVLIGSSNHNSTIGSGVGSQLQIEGNTYQTSSLALINNSTSTDPAFINFGKSRAGSSGGTTIVQDGDRLGGIRFSGADGSDLHSRAAQIEVYVDGTPGGNDLPGRIVMETTPDGSSYPTTHEILYGSTKEIRNSGYYVAQSAGSGGSATPSFGATQSGMSASSYNYILSGSNDGGNKCVLFVNGSTRSADGGGNELTLRNDGGGLTLGHNGNRTTLRGDFVVYPERPAFHVTNFTWSNSTKFAHGGTATYNRGSDWDVSTGTFTAPVAGDYVMFISVQVHAPSEITGRNATYSNIYAQKNGSNIGGEIVGTTQIGGYGFHNTLTHSLVVYLAANDTFRWNSSYGFRYGQNTLYGYLLG